MIAGLGGSWEGVPPTVMIAGFGGSSGGVPPTVMIAGVRGLERISRLK
jgi:hypothetical protein